MWEAETCKKAAKLNSTTYVYCYMTDMWGGVLP